MPDSGAVRYCTASGRLSSIPNVDAFSCEARCTARDGASLLSNHDAPGG